MKRETLNRLGIGAKKDILPEDVFNPGIDLGFYGLSKKDGEKLEVLHDFVREYNAERPMKFSKTPITDSRLAAGLLKDRIGNLETEELWAAFLNAGLVPVAVERMSAGGTDTTVIDRRQILKRALALNAAGIIIYHNHPSGNPRPSTGDIKRTESLHEACRTMAMNLHDHIIIAGGEFYSFTEDRLYND